MDKQALRKRYSAKPTPKCDICGAKMTIQRMSGSRVTYGCSGAIYDETGCHYAEGRSLADDHYEQSRVTVVDVSDPDVLALLDELEASAKQNALDIQIKARLCRESNSLHDRLREAEKRIAELEAREVNLPKRSIGEVMHMSGFSRDYAEGWCSGNDNAIHEIHAADIKVVTSSPKGE
ncbi:ead/Ea22-like family protein [Citrobacter koseri]|uniref:ead/Ea22-like family protein n=1 Tax=Citrobacter koseri TaxID=545 RepID=UPI002FCD161B|nr:ead/Ea22-like family protein [Citrobacter koseri]